MDPRLKKWIGWLEVIEGNIQNMLINRNIFWEVQKIIKNNDKIQKPSSFYRYLGDTYISYITIGIRRQIKIDKQNISFARLLTEMKETPSVLSRNYYKSLYKGSNVEEYADRDFEKFVGDNPAYISASLVSEDLNELKLTANKVEDFADRRIAHHDMKEPRILPKFDDVDYCLDVLEKMYLKYHMLFHASAMLSLMPVYQYDWTEIFQEPWLPPKTELFETF